MNELHRVMELARNEVQRLDINGHELNVTDSIKVPLEKNLVYCNSNFQHLINHGHVDQPHVHPCASMRAR